MATKLQADEITLALPGEIMANLEGFISMLADSVDNAGSDEEGRLVLVIPREKYEETKNFVGILGEAMAAADSKVKADEAQANAAQKGADLMGKIAPGAPQPGQLAGLAEEVMADPRYN